MKKPTFNQAVAAAMLPLFLILLGAVYFVPSKNPSEEGGIIAIIITAFTTCLHFLVGSTTSSAAKDEAITSEKEKMIDALANSQPCNSSLPTKESSASPTESLETKKN